MKTLIYILAGVAVVGGATYYGITQLDSNDSTVAVSTQKSDDAIVLEKYCGKVDEKDANGNKVTPEYLAKYKCMAEAIATCSPAKLDVFDTKFSVHEEKDGLCTVDQYVPMQEGETESQSWSCTAPIESLADELAEGRRVKNDRSVTDVMMVMGMFIGLNKNVPSDQRRLTYTYEMYSCKPL